jgi:hypothetical protein
MKAINKLKLECRNILRNPAIQIEAGPGFNGERGAWLLVEHQTNTIKITRGKCRNAWLYEVWFFTPEGERTSRKFSQLDDALREAGNLVVVSPPQAAIIGSLPADQLAVLAEVVEKLQKVLDPLKISLPAGLEEYLAVKERVGVKDLRELAGSNYFGGIPKNQIPLVSAALDQLREVLHPLEISLPAGLEEYAGAKRHAGHRDLREIVTKYLADDWAIPLR